MAAEPRTHATAFDEALALVFTDVLGPGVDDCDLHAFGGVNYSHCDGTSSLWAWVQTPRGQPNVQYRLLQMHGRLCLHGPTPYSVDCVIGPAITGFRSARHLLTYTSALLSDFHASVLKTRYAQTRRKNGNFETIFTQFQLAYAHRRVQGAWRREAVPVFTEADWRSDKYGVAGSSRALEDRMLAVIGERCVR